MDVYMPIINSYENVYYTHIYITGQVGYLLGMSRMRVGATWYQMIACVNAILLKWATRGQSGLGLEWP